MPPCGRSPSASATGPSSLARSARRPWPACCGTSITPTTGRWCSISDIMNAELRDLAAAGCPLIQVEEPRHHGLTTRPDCTEADLEFQTEVFNRQLAGVDAEIWVHTCWGNPNQQRVYWEVPSYERALPHLLQLDADVITFECASSDGRDLPLFANYKTDKKIGIGVVNHCIATVEPAEY